MISDEEITQPGSVKVLEGEGMPIKDSSEKGNLYVLIKVHIPNFSDKELDELDDFFKRFSKLSYSHQSMPIITNN